MFNSRQDRVTPALPLTFYNMQISKLASAIYNDIVAGLSGYTSTPAISLEQLEDEVVEERL
jgi:hypothetical protein